ncbi:NAD(P)-dependent oxidoreductase [Clostridium cylindrosporum]|uniref:Sulfide dehydrogenase subunit alpha n=1 Tax=Clostridium cylindrosporum DSM 605 TaxID=1121307 RepID=A0A0J8DCG3_CLOCY|nr:NAD(P)-dependent oxidoreductase [Clostridium cylindrosporum]KMT21989.1 sulfide dehydrogenase subunit alpha [Clostridium cylindrosporum DSM 605]
MAHHIVEEAKRCLQCKVPRCRTGCPVNTPINEAIAMLLEGNIVEAGEKLFSNNPLSIVCSLVCPHERYCEGHCVLSHKSNPIHWSSIEHYISDYYLDKVNINTTIDPNKKVAIVGSGPAGITISIILASRGYDITLFEMNDKIGGVLRYGIPEFRLPNTIIDRLTEKLKSIGVKIKPNSLIGSVPTINDIFRDGYKAIFIGTGVWRPNPLNIKGEHLGHVHYAIDYLKNPDVHNLGKKVCVIGAGNVAIDVARTALRKGIKKVDIMYRKGEEDMSASKHEITYAKLDGVNFEFYKTPVEFNDDGIIYLDTEKVTEDGNEKVITLEASKKLFEADSIIIATGQMARMNTFSYSKDLELNEFGLVKADEFGRTSRDGVFASGDVVTGARTVVEAVKFSKKVADAIDEYISGI